MTTSKNTFDIVPNIINNSRSNVQHNTPNLNENTHLIIDSSGARTTKHSSSPLSTIVDKAPSTTREQHCSAAVAITTGNLFMLNELIVRRLRKGKRERKNDSPLSTWN